MTGGVTYIDHLNKFPGTNPQVGQQKNEKNRFPSLLRKYYRGNVHTKEIEI